MLDIIHGPTPRPLTQNDHTLISSPPLHGHDICFGKHLTLLQIVPLYGETKAAIYTVSLNMYACLKKNRNTWINTPNQILLTY